MFSDLLASNKHKLTLHVDPRNGTVSAQFVPCFFWVFWLEVGIQYMENDQRACLFLLVDRAAAITGIVPSFGRATQQERRFHRYYKSRGAAVHNFVSEGEVEEEAAGTEEKVNVGLQRPTDNYEEKWIG